MPRFVFATALIVACVAAGGTSAQMRDPAPPPPPVITEFSAYSDVVNVWHLEGTVAYANPSDLTVKFRGAVEEQTTVDSDGSFRCTVIVTPGTSGEVTAQAFAPGGQTSDFAYAYITQ